jgi:hypothetical protein
LRPPSIATWQRIESVRAQDKPLGPATFATRASLCVAAEAAFINRDGRPWRGREAGPGPGGERVRRNGVGGFRYT